MFVPIRVALVVCIVTKDIPICHLYGTADSFFQIVERSCGCRDHAARLD